MTPEQRENLVEEMAEAYDSHAECYIWGADHHPNPKMQAALSVAEKAIMNAALEEAAVYCDHKKAANNNDGQYSNAAFGIRAMKSKP